MPRRAAVVALVAAGAALAALAAPAFAGGPRTVDVVLNVGPRTGGGACTTENETTCELVRLKATLGATPKVDVLKTLVGAAEVGPPDSAPVEPALSPDGTRLAWVERAGKSWQIWARELNDPKNHLLVKSGPPKDGGLGAKPEWPAWLGSQTLLFDAKTGDAGDVELKTVYSMAVANLGAPGAPVKRFGAGVDSATGLQDVNLRVTSTGADAVTFGPSGDGKSFNLDIRSLDGSGRPLTDRVVVPRGVTASGKELQACHHPAWSPSGTSVLCMAHRPAEVVGDLDTKLLYRYARDGSGAWVNAGRVFEPLTPAAAGLDVAGELSKAAGCVNLTYKFAEYCKSDEWVISTLYCSRGASPSGHGAIAGASRVVLIHTNPVEYVDLTRLVERERGLEAGALTSFTGTCRALE